MVVGWYLVYSIAEGITEERETQRAGALMSFECCRMSCSIRRRVGYVRGKNARFAREHVGWKLSKDASDKLGGTSRSKS